MCFHWKSLRRQIRVSGQVSVINDKEADDYFNSRAYGSRIGAWASSQSQVRKNREEFLNKIKEYEMKYPDQKKFQDLHIGLVGDLFLEKLSFGLKLKIGYTKD